MGNTSRNFRRQKIEENYFFLQFKDLCSEISGYSYKQIDESKENGPDIICHGPNQKIGIEITKIIPFASIKGYESTEKKLIALAQKSYSKLGDRPLLVWFSFKRVLHIKGNEIKSLADEIIALITENTKDNSGVIEINQALPRGIKSITIIKLEDGAKNSWGVISALSAVPTISEELIKESIKKKEQKLPKYIEACDALWLLLVVPGYDPSEWLEFDNWNQHISYQSVFDRTYILDVQNSVLKKLNTSNSQPFNL